MKLDHLISYQFKNSFILDFIKLNFDITTLIFFFMTSIIQFNLKLFNSIFLIVVILSFLHYILITFLQF
jgi:hypothetical protein